MTYLTKKLIVGLATGGSAKLPGGRRGVEDQGALPGTLTDSDGNIGSENECYVLCACLVLN